MQLQTAIYQSEFHHRELQAEYDFCKRAFEKLAELDWDDSGNPLRDHFSKALSAFWRKIEKKTRAYTNVLDLLEKKDVLESTIKELWKSHLNPASRSQSCQHDIPCVPGFEEYAQMKLGMSSLRLRRTRYNTMRYKFALEHVQEMNDKIRDIKQNRKKKSIFSIKGSGKIRKLQNDICWYRKNEKSLAKEVEKLQEALDVLAYKLDVGKQKWLQKAVQEASKECGLKTLPIDVGQSRDRVNKRPVCLPNFLSGMISPLKTKRTI